MGKLEQARAILACVACIACVICATSAHAQSEPAAPPAIATPPAAASQPWREAKDRLPPPNDPESASQERIWYGWQTLLSDALGLGLVAFGGDSAIPGIIGLSVLGLGAPLVHFAHSNVEAAVYSLVIRGSAVGLLVLGAVLVLEASDEEGS